MSGGGFERLWDRPPFAVDFLAGGGGDLVIAFASVGHDPSRPPAPEFVATASGRGTTAHPRRALFVLDAGRGWASDPGFAPALLGAVERVRARAPITRIACIGLSMGGFAALAAMQVLPVDVALAFGPQHRVLGRMPDRWSRWTDRIGTTPFPVAPLPRPPQPGPGQGWAVVCHGLEDDAEEAKGFAVQPGTDHLLFKGQSHSGLVPHLKARGVLAGLMAAALAGDRRRLLRIAGSAGGLRRRDPGGGALG